MTPWKFFAVLAITACSTFPSSASTEELSGRLFDALNIEGATFTAEQRTAVARAASDYWDNFDSRIPRNSPEDAAWLRGELSTRDMERIERAVSTPQFALDQLVQLAEHCNHTHRLLLGQIGGDRLAELYLWLKVSTCYHSTHSTLTYLQQAGLSNGKADGPFHMLALGLVQDSITGSIANSVYGP